MTPALTYKFETDPEKIETLQLIQSWTGYEDIVFCNINNWGIYYRALRTRIVWQMERF